MFNETVCRDTSVRVRSQLEIKRRSGDFIGSFAVFGYLKDPADHHRLIVDSYAAGVVRDIFQWKLEGISAGDIADRLNETGIFTPQDYKRSLGMRAYTPFRSKSESTWCAGMVLRILKNPVYIGVLEQGRVTTFSYKVKKKIYKPREEWAVIPNHHEAIIDPYDFETVQRVLALDTRTSESGKAVELFSGMVVCGECGAAMIRKTVPSGRKKYVYYICAAHKNDKTCYGHSIRDTMLEEIVLESTKQHIEDVVGLANMLDLAGTAQLQKAKVKKLEERLEKKQEEVDRCQTLLRSLYESLTEGIIDHEEYHDLKKTYTRRREEAEAQAAELQREMEQEVDNASDRGWIKQFRKHQGITALDRYIVVSLIERIMVYRDHRVEVIFRWHDEFQYHLELLAQAQGLPLSEEVV